MKKIYKAFLVPLLIQGINLSVHAMEEFSRDALLTQTLPLELKSNIVSYIPKEQQSELLLISKDFTAVILPALNYIYEPECKQYSITFQDNPFTAYIQAYNHEYKEMLTVYKMESGCAYRKFNVFFEEFANIMKHINASTEDTLLLGQLKLKQKCCEKVIEKEFSTNSEFKKAALQFLSDNPASGNLPLKTLDDRTNATNFVNHYLTLLNNGATFESLKLRKNILNIISYLHEDPGAMEETIDFLALNPDFIDAPQQPAINALHQIIGKVNQK